MKIEGTLKVRQITPSSLGLTLPKELVTTLGVEPGTYLYEALSSGDKIHITMSMLVKKGGVTPWST